MINYDSILSARERNITIVYMIFLGLITYMIIPIYPFIPGGYPIKLAAGFITSLIIASIYNLILHIVITWPYSNKTSRKTESQTFFICFLSFLGICIIYLLAYYPGVMTDDSFTQWNQMEKFKFNDWHPAFSTLFNWLITRIWHSPAAIVFVNSLLFSGVFAAITVWLKSLGLDNRILIVISLVFIINPVNGIMAVTVWKDIPYSISLLWLTYLAMKVVYSEGCWLHSIRNKMIFSGSLVFAALIRHNGIVPLMLVIIALFILYKKYWKNIAIVTLISLGVITFIKIPIYKALNVTPGSPFQSLVNPIMQVGGIISRGGSLTEEEQAVVNEILPLEKWKEGYKIYSEVPLASMEGFNMGYFKENKTEFLKAWAGMALRNPKLAFRAYMYRTAIIWRIINPPGSAVFTNNRGVSANTLGFATDSQLPYVKDAFNFLQKALNSRFFIWIGWKPATYLLIIMLFGFIAILKNGYKWLLVLLPVLGNTLGLLLVTTSDQPRYYYPTLIIAPFIIGAAFIKNKKQEDKLKAQRGLIYEADNTNTLP